MKKLRLKMWVKVVLTIVMLVGSVIIYNHTGKIGNLAVKNNLYATLIIAEWFWLIIGQSVILYIMWEK